MPKKKQDDFLNDIILPINIKPLYISLAKYLVYLNLKWRFYNELYGNENSRGLLSDTAKIFFVTIEQSLRYEMTLVICHLSEQAEYVNKKTGKITTSLSLETLINRCGNPKELKASFREFKKKSEPFRKLRNKVIAHYDLDIALKPDAYVLPKIDKDAVDNVIRIVESILSDIATKNGNPQQIIFNVPTVIGGAGDLIYWLKEGMEYQENTLRDLKEGRLPEKFKPH